MRITIVLIVLLAPLLCVAQILEFHSLQRLPPAVNSAGEESLPLMSHDGKELFFTRALYAGNRGGKFSGLDAWVAGRAGRTWSNANNQLPVGMNNEGHNAIVGISRDGKKCFFLDARPGEKVLGIYVVSRTNGNWTRPEPVLIPGIENAGFLGIHVSPDEDVIFLSMKAADSRGEEDLYFSVRNTGGQWSAPRNLGSTINSQGYEIAPFWSPDKKRLYFSSNGHGGEGDADIFYSERLFDSWEAWSLPVNLGEQVNSKKFDAYFSIYGDSLAYFASNRDGRYADLYQVAVTYRRTVLSDGQRYLSADESNRVLGGAVSGELTFLPRTSSLTGAQQELLFYIGNKLQLQKTILLHLVVLEEEHPETTNARIKAIRDYLVQSGIAEERIIDEQVERPQASPNGKIAIRLIE